MNTPIEKLILDLQALQTHYQFSAPGVENYIGNLQRLTGVLDDELRPAFQQLLMMVFHHHFQTLPTKLKLLQELSVYSSMT